MADFIFNRSKGRWVEFCERINANDPSTAGLVIAFLAASGIEADDVLNNADDFVGLVAGTTNEAVNAGYARKTLSDAGAPIVITYDDTNNRVDVDFPDQTFTGISGTAPISDVVVGYDSVLGSGTDSGIIPISQHDFSVTPDGSDITVQLASAGFARAA